MRPSDLKTRIFLDSGDPAETREALEVLGFLDGQTTNPSLIAKNPETAGKKFSQAEIFEFYEKVVQEIYQMIPHGSVSIEVYADSSTSSEEMLKQGRDFFLWLPPQPHNGGGAHIKYPTTSEGLLAAERSVKEGMRVNMTLCFSQEQAAAVYAATRGAKKGQVYLSPFVGRLDDRGENGMDLIDNIKKMYSSGDGHVEVLTASVRNNTHMKKAIELGSDIITAPLKVIKSWKESAEEQPAPQLKAIPYIEVDLTKDWQEYDIKHELTDKGIEKFAQDWNSLIK